MKTINRGRDRAFGVKSEADASSYSLAQHEHFFIQVGVI
jgi:hypothetical protein